MPTTSTRLFWPARPRRTFEEIIGQIQALIDSGQIARGERLPSERALAIQFEVSRNTVREALRMLEISGQVALKRGAQGGAFVTEHDTRALNMDLTSALSLSSFSITDLTQAMRAIFIMLLAEAGDRLDNSVLDVMEATVDEAEAWTGSALERSNILIRFYGQLAGATGNPVLVVFADVIAELLQKWVMRLGSLGGNAVITSRRRIIARLRKGDHKGAQTELENHLRRLRDRWIKGS